MKFSKILLVLEVIYDYHNKTCVNWHVWVAGCHYMPVFVSLMQKDNYHIVW